ncbi:MAG: hypothetical protein GYA24_14040 [Candidatus Lokiarchaeota archaeon]|nr:hypothetical protein [Candidatus Lokiarchaeota archaeon]
MQVTDARFANASPSNRVSLSNIDTRKHKSRVNSMRGSMNKLRSRAATASNQSFPATRSSAWTWVAIRTRKITIAIEGMRKMFMGEGCIAELLSPSESTETKATRRSARCVS